MKIRGDKLTANAFYLVAATATMGFVGLLFWRLAAHEGHARNHFADYGRAYAEVAALTLVLVVAQAFVWLDQRVRLILAVTASSAVVMIGPSLILIGRPAGRTSSHRLVHQR